MGLFPDTFEIERKVALKNIEKIEKSQKEILDEQKKAHWKYLILTVVAILATSRLDPIVSDVAKQHPWVDVPLFIVLIGLAMWVVRKI